jgi:CubicO group peptidase (beta-lactamase class C family)
VSKLLATALMFVFVASLAPAQETVPQGGPPPRQLRGRAVEGMVESAGDASLRQFIETHLAPKYRDSFATPDKLVEHLRAIRKACAGFGGILVDPVGDNGLLMKFMLDGGEAAVMMRIDAAPPHQIVALDLEQSTPRAKGPEVAPITWDDLAARLDEEAAKGFAGTVLVVRGAKVVLHQGYGLANREWSIPNDSQTIFAIGSVPIDFTRGAILKLEEQGKLLTSDLVSKFIDPVPADKKAMTIDHL